MNGQDARAEARTMIQKGVGVAVASAVLTAAISGAAAFDLRLLPGASPWGLVDAAFCAAMAFGIGRGSRACAVLMLVYWIADKSSLLVASGDPAVSAGAIGGSLVMALYLANAVRGTFRVRALERLGRRVGRRDEHELAAALLRS
jgi:hypothetical protein